MYIQGINMAAVNAANKKEAEPVQITQTDGGTIATMAINPVFMRLIAETAAKELGRHSNAIEAAKVAKDLAEFLNHGVNNPNYIIER